MPEGLEVTNDLLGDLARVGDPTGGSYREHGIENTAPGGHQDEQYGSAKEQITISFDFAVVTPYLNTNNNG